MYKSTPSNNHGSTTSSAHIIVPSLCGIFNLAVPTSMSSYWRWAIKKYASNYGPPSLDSAVCKVHELLLKGKLQYLQSHIIIRGFIPKMTASPIFLDWRSRYQPLIDDKKDVDVVYNEFAKMVFFFCKLHGYGGHWTRKSVRICVSGDGV